jgi:hypothetical protein
MSKYTINETLPTLISSLRVISNDGSGKSVNLAGKGLVLFLYHESILSDTIHASIEYADTGSTFVTDDSKNVRESLPIVGTEKVEVKFEDNSGQSNQIPKIDLYVNKINPLGDDARKSIVRLELVSKEFLLNEKIRLRKRYDGRISDHINDILTESTPDGLQTQKNIDVEETQNNLNFLGNNKKSLYTLNWLSKKAVSQSNQKKGSSAGFFFYETANGFFFKSIDGLLAQQPKKKIVYNEVPDEEGKTIRNTKYDYKALAYSKDDLINSQDKLRLGTFSTRIVTFDPFNCEYNIYSPNSSENEQRGELELGGKSLPKLNPEFDVNGDQKNFSRTTYVLLDTGSMPSGDSEQQIDKSNEENFDNRNILNQSIMRYNQFLSYSCSITIPPDFSLHAGDAITLDVPLIEVDKTTKSSSMDSGLYIITDLTHYVSGDGTYTRLELVRDSIGRKRN